MKLEFDNGRLTLIAPDLTIEQIKEVFRLPSVSQWYEAVKESEGVTAYYNVLLNEVKKAYYDKDDSRITMFCNALQENCENTLKAILLTKATYIFAKKKATTIDDALIQSISEYDYKAFINSIREANTSAIKKV